MKSKARVLSVLVCTLLLAGCDDPFIFASGGALKGTVADLPAVWQLEKDSDLAQLETRPEDPYSINLVYVQMDGHFYFYAGDTRTNWVKHIEQDPRVRVRIGDIIYPGRAVRVTDDEEIADFAAIWSSRSLFQRDPLQFDEVWLYRLEAR